MKTFAEFRRPERPHARLHAGIPSNVPFELSHLPVHPLPVGTQQALSYWVLDPPVLRKWSALFWYLRFVIASSWCHLLAALAYHEAFKIVAPMLSHLINHVSNERVPMLSHLIKHVSNERVYHRVTASKTSPSVGRLATRTDRSSIRHKVSGNRVIVYVCSIRV